MDNQQERTVGKAFIAGLAVGEGSFCLAVSKRKTTAQRPEHTVIVPMFYIGMKDLDTLEIVYNSLREAGLGAHWTRRYEHPNNPTQSRIQVNGMKRVEKLIRWLRNDLTGDKKRAAELVLSFIESRRERPKGSPYSEQEKEIVRTLRSVNGNKNGRKNLL